MDDQIMFLRNPMMENADVRSIWAEEVIQNSQEELLEYRNPYHIIDDRNKKSYERWLSSNKYHFTQRKTENVRVNMHDEFL